MDIPRKPVRHRNLIRGLYILIVLLAVVLVTVGLSYVKPALPVIDRSTVWIDTAKRGQMVRQVRGNGTLIPEEIRWIPALTEGQVKHIFIKPGEVVSRNTVILELGNAELQQEALNAEWQIKAGQADYESLRVKLESESMNQKAAASTVQSEYSQARLSAEVNQNLAEEGLIPPIANELSKIRAEEMHARNELEKQRVAINLKASQAQLQSQRAKVEQLKAYYQLKLNQIESLKVKAEVEGILQQVSVEIGKHVSPGTNLALVARQDHLKAQLKVAENQAKDIQLNQSVIIDTHNGTITGHVSRIDPSVQNGTVTVEVVLSGQLPKGARPDLTVDGTIEIERLENVLYIGRPAFGNENNTISVFKLDSNGKIATRVNIKLGRSSVNTIEILDGLKEGDQVIISDISSWDKFERINLN
jgi:HlyD family secretion protein